MILQDIYLDRIDWHVRVYHAVDAFWALEILEDLIALGCKGEELKAAKRNLWSGLPNNGITFTNPEKRRTLMVVGFTSNGAEYWNTLDHEKQHLLDHVGSALSLSPHGETIAYVSGEFMREVYYSDAKSLLCDTCRNHIGAKSC